MGRTALNKPKKPIFVFNSFYLPGFKSGGPVKSIYNIVANLGDEFDFKIVTQGKDLSDQTYYQNVKLNAWNTLGKSTVWYLGPNSFQLLIDELRKHISIPYYLNSFFDLKFTILPLLLSQLGILRPKTIVVAPRGELSVGALSIKKTKKLVYIHLFKLLGWHKKIIWHASNSYEKDDILKIFKDGSIQVASDLVAFEGLESVDNQSDNSLVFFSRISRKKNLSYALESLKYCRSNLIFKIYGTLEDPDYWAECQNIIRSLPSHIQVKYCNSVNPDQVTNTLKTCGLFFFPTRGENYGHVIAEALMAGLPLLISNTTPWNDIEDHGAGWVRKLDSPQAFAEVIDSFMKLSEQQKQELRNRVKVYAKLKLIRPDDITANRKLFSQI